MISLLSENILVAEKWMRCDAFSIWLDVSKSIEIKKLEQGISTWFGARKQIEKDNPYWHFEFLDKETGEVSELNCRVDMHSFMLKENYYPKIILALLNNH
jgi:hypothetical protein